MTIPKRFNEGKALDAVIRHIEARDSLRRAADGRSPEQDVHAAPIDYACTIGDRLYALEHTGIEPFSGQIEDEEHGKRLFGPMAALLAGSLPTAEWIQLHVPIGATLGLSQREAKQALDALVSWVRETASTLPIAPYGRYITPIRKVLLPGVPFRVSLHRIAAGPPLCGRFDALHVTPSDIEAARMERLRKVCASKFPKLAVWRRDHSARTVLVLEDGDIQLTNEQLVYEALIRAEDGREDRPDEIYMVNTTIKNRWWVTCLRRHGKTYYDDGERYREVDPRSLTPLTGR